MVVFVIRDYRNGACLWVSIGLNISLRTIKRLGFNPSGYYTADIMVVKLQEVSTSERLKIHLLLTKAKAKAIFFL